MPTPVVFDESTAAWLIKTGKLVRAPGSSDGGVNTLLAQAWWGVVVTAGPASEADYTDERYWIRRARIDGSVTDHIQLVWWNRDFPQAGGGTDTGFGTDPVIVTATNRCELILKDDATYGTGTHRLSKGTPVVIRQDSDSSNPPAPRYWFEHAPAGDVPLQIMGNAAAVGTYQVGILKPPTTAFDPTSAGEITSNTFGDAPGTFNAYFVNAAETDRPTTATTTHDLASGTIVFGSMRPVLTSDGKPIFMGRAHKNQDCTS